MASSPLDTADPDDSAEQPESQPSPPMIEVGEAWELMEDAGEASQAPAQADEPESESGRARSGESIGEVSAGEVRGPTSASCAADASEPSDAGDAPDETATGPRRTASDTNIHTRRTMPPPVGIEGLAPSVAAQKLRSRKKTLEFAPLKLVESPPVAAASVEAGPPAASDATARPTPTSSIPAPGPLVLSDAAIEVPRSAATGFSEPAPPAPAARNERAHVPIATPPARAAVILDRDKLIPPLPGPPADSPDVVAAALEPHLAWLEESGRKALFKHLLRGEYGDVLRLLRVERQRSPRIVNIPKAMAIVEQAECSRLLFELGATSSEIVVLSGPTGSEGSPRETLLRLARSRSTLGELLASSPLPRMRTLAILHDLADDGAITLRQGQRSKAVTGFGKGGLTENSKRPSEPEEKRLAEPAELTIPPRPVDREEVPGEELDERTPLVRAAVEEAEADWSEGLEVLAHARAEVAERASSNQPGPAPELDDVDRDPDEETDPQQAEAAPDSDEPISRASLRVELAPELARLEALDVLLRTSLRPPRIERGSGAGLTEAPDAAASATATAPRAVEASLARAQWITLPAALAALIVSTIALALLVLRAPSEPAKVSGPSPAAPSAIAPPPAAAPTPVPAPAQASAAALATEAATVTLIVEVKPAYTRFYLDGMLMAHPARAVLPRDGAKHELKFEAGGYKSEVREFTATQDATFVITLDPRPRRAVDETPSAIE